MITKKDVLNAVADAWWEQNPKIVEFVNHHLSREGGEFSPQSTPISRRTFRAGSEALLPIVRFSKRGRT